VKILVAAAVYALAQALVAAMAFSALMALAAEDQSSRIGSFAEFVVLCFGWVTVLVLPAYVAAIVWRRLGDTTAHGKLVTLWGASAALVFSLVLALMLHIYDCFVEGSGLCPTWAAHLLVYMVVCYVPALLCVWVAKSTVEQWRTMLGG
jgi:hypothetical protein